MTEYRLYFIDEREHIRGAEDMLAPDDRDALRQAKGHPDARIKELWRGNKKVARLTQVHPQAPARTA